MKVAKFGGTSLASANQIKKVCSIVTSDPERRIVIVSAPGKRFKDDVKVTDMLIACANAGLEKGNADSELQALVDRFAEIASELNVSDRVIEEIADDLRARVDSDKSDKGKYMDCLKAAGEDNCAKLVAAYLQSTGVDARYVNPGEAGLLLNDEYGNAQVLPKAYDNLKSLSDYSGITIFPGFFGHSLKGDVVTLPRGGSDISGSIVAAAVNADLYENFTDVDNIYSVNPNLINSPKPIRELTYREMRELSYAGFSVFHEEALVPVYNRGIPVCVKNTNNPSAPGTTIVPERSYIKEPVVGIASHDGFCFIYISKYLMNREVGFGRRVLQILEDEHISFDHMPSGIDNMSIIIKQNFLDEQMEKRIVERIKKELAVDDVSVVRNLALVVIVGEGMRNTRGITARASTSLAKAGINLEMISQGPSEVSMIFGVRAGESDKAVCALYNEFFNSQGTRI
ncbi:MAG: aspartate kinase [Clostridiaceae bacterium]|jgi:aspartate kinase|nr:aspartate kinase [Clostridiaceae bacterium]